MPEKPGVKGLIQKRISNLIERLSDWMNDYTVGRKLRILYVCCVLFPLIVTDSVILTIVIRSDRASAAHGLENIARAVKYNLTSAVENAETIANNIYTNQYINDFLIQEYETALDYYNAFQKIRRETLLVGSIAASGIQPMLYADNDTIINGWIFRRLNDKERAVSWYRHLSESRQDRMLYIYYDESNMPVVDARRKISLIRKLNYYQRDNCEKILKLDIDYGKLVRDITEMNYEAPVYVCMGDQIIFSNVGHSSIWKDYELFTEGEKVGYQASFRLCGQELSVNVLKKETSIFRQIWDKAPFILFLIFINAVLPWFFMQIINRSFTGRLRDLSTVFDRMEDEKMQEIECVRGQDEIGALMQNYNRMAARINDLIQTVYKGKLKEQEINIARQKAELLALHSQINPHFLFNALESIRMHSVLKGERETAHMVEKLAVMERQYVDWGTDFVTIEEEMGVVEAYLELQKYRFGDRLSYNLEIDEGCLTYRIPKLTLVTFAENACVHGIEDKSTPGWIFVRVFIENDMFCMEIEDTGNGIRKPLLSELKEKMAHAGIASLRKKGHVGIMNACLRLRMMTQDKVRFELESEEGAGTIVTVRIPLASTKTEEV